MVCKRLTRRKVSRKLTQSELPATASNLSLQRKRICRSSDVRRLWMSSASSCALVRRKVAYLAAVAAAVTSRMWHDSPRLRRLASVAAGMVWHGAEGNSCVVVLTRRTCCLFGVIS